MKQTILTLGIIIHCLTIAAPRDQYITGNKIRRQQPQTMPSTSSKNSQKKLTTHKIKKSLRHKMMQLKNADVYSIDDLLREIKDEYGDLFTKAIFTPDIRLGIKQSIFDIGDALNIIDEKIDNLGPKTCFTGGTITTPGSYILCGNLDGVEIRIEADNVSLDLNGYTITPSGSLAYSIKIIGSNVHVYNGLIQEDPTSFNITGIDIEDAHNIAIENIQISDSKEGIYCKNVTGCLIQNGIFQNCWSGITYEDVNGGAIQNCVINNTGDGYGISLGRTIGSTIQNCTIHDCVRGIRLFDTSGCTIQKSNIAVCQEAGIYLEPNSDYNTFYQCHIAEIEKAGGPLYGCYIKNSAHNTFQECTIENVKSTSFNSEIISGFRIEESSNNKIINCKIESINSESTTTDSDASFGVHMFGLTNNQNNTIKNNIINGILSSQGSAIGIYLFSDLSDQGKHIIAGNTVQNTSSNYTAHGIHNLSANTIITNNTINNVESTTRAASGILTGTNHTTITKNVIDSIVGSDEGATAGATGIYCTQSSYNIIKNNCINYIENQTISSDKEYGIFISDTSDNNIINENEMEDSYFGLKILGINNLVLGNCANNNTTAYDGPDIITQDTDMTLSNSYKINYYYQES